MSESESLMDCPTNKNAHAAKTVKWVANVGVPELFTFDAALKNS